MWARGSLYAAWQGLQGWDRPADPPCGGRGEVVAYACGRALGVGLVAALMLGCVIGVWWLAVMAEGGL